jgi:hypothetical protein
MDILLYFLYLQYELYDWSIELFRIAGDNYELL